MLPVVAGATSTRWQILLYTLPMAAAAIAPSPLGLAGPIYGVIAVALNAVFLVLSIAVARSRTTEPKEMAAEKRLFGFSVLYLFIMFGALVVDRLLIGWA
jgi:protoheme IX farnesyltransferase